MILDGGDVASEILEASWIGSALALGTIASIGSANGQLISQGEK